jgi:hypothetical protein
MSYWLLDIGLYPARPAERFARRMPISLPQEASLAAHRLPPTNDPRVHPAYPGRPRGRAGHCPTTSHDDGQVQTDASAGPAPPAPASSTRLRLRQTTSRAWTQRRPRRPRPSQPYGCLPHRRAPGPHFGRTQRTPQRTNTGRPHRAPTPDAGQRTPGRSDARTGHWTSAPLDRQAWTLVARTGHQTLDAGRGRGHANEGAAGIRTSWATTPSDRALGRPTAFSWTAPTALGSPCRLGDEAAIKREIASRRQLLGRSAGVERRLGALLS